MKLINGGGRAETEAAHVMSVEAGGPDAVNNGIALSGTIHWMFDRGRSTIARAWSALSTTIAGRGFLPGRRIGRIRDTFIGTVRNASTTSLE
ncbi:HNH endonuclease signature motif containing protein [Sphingomonas sp. BIUV-7]|uniref:HNH endonuclease signature motif containing protein n=1 Tax=Sphingomonas natans TaxID=3063330 RepID=A0ABT8Y742_9SPHN|nr:HNH endonuclease signature motif containing protein [Sphingomonas sp. BIUV-7]MDO6413728.1 HNH endonuclease signature motif containing protein [Sphingomonas sp. BIUV-7]